jgi:hypothetical protein
MRCFKLAFLAVLCVCLAGAASAAVIDVGSYTFAPDSGSHTITLSVSGGDTVVGLELYAQVGEDTAGPEITNIDITEPGMVFSTAPSVTQAVEGRSAYAFVNANGTPPQTYTANGQLVELTVDTTGVATGTYSLKLKDLSGYYEGFDTNFLTYVGGSYSNLFPTIGVGEIKIQAEAIPEPASMLLMAGLMACGAPALLVYRRRTHATAC